MPRVEVEVFCTKFLLHSSTWYIGCFSRPLASATWALYVRQGVVVSCDNQIKFAKKLVVLGRDFLHFYLKGFHFSFNFSINFFLLYSIGHWVMENSVKPVENTVEKFFIMIFQFIFTVCFIWPLFYWLILFKK